MVQDLTGTPSSSTVQAPQLVVSQPMWVPVSASVSRMKWTRRRRGSTSAVRSTSLTVIVTAIVVHATSLQGNRFDRTAADRAYAVPLLARSTAARSARTVNVRTTARL